MSVNIWLEDVPDAILEAVKARLMRRRKDLLEDNEQKKREASEPGPQLVEFGGDSDEWRRPEPGVVGGQRTFVGHSVQKQQVSTINYEQNYAGFSAPLSPPIFIGSSQFYLRNLQTGSVPDSISWTIWTGNREASITTSLLTSNVSPEPFNVSKRSRTFLIGPFGNVGDLYLEADANDYDGTFGMPFRFRTDTYWSSTISAISRLTDVYRIVLPVGKQSAVVVCMSRYKASVSTRRADAFYSYVGNNTPILSELGEWLDAGITTFYFNTASATDNNEYLYGQISAVDPEYEPNFDQDPWAVKETAFARANKAFIVSKSSVREIEIKGSLLTLVNHMNPIESNLSSIRRLVTFPLEGIVTFSGPSVNYHEPKIYETINLYATLYNLPAFIDSSLIKQFRSKTKKIITDFRNGFYFRDYNGEIKNNGYFYLEKINISYRGLCNNDCIKEIIKGCLMIIF